MIAKVKFFFNIEADREAVQRFECGRREFRYLGILEMSLRNSPSLLRLFICPGRHGAAERFECGRRECRYEGIPKMSLQKSLLPPSIYPGFAIKRNFGLAAMSSMPPGSS